MTLSGLRSLDKSAIVGLLFVVSGKRDPQGRKLLVGFEPAKAFLGFVHGRGGPLLTGHSFRLKRSVFCPSIYMGARLAHWRVPIIDFNRLERTSGNCPVLC